MNTYKKAGILAVVFLTALQIAACGQKLKGDETVTAAEKESAFAVSRQEGSTQTEERVTEESTTEESIHPEIFPTGEYCDDMGSQLIITKADDENYEVTYGIYKLAYMENAVGNYDINTGILSFSGTDDMGNTLSADAAIQGDNLTITLTDSEYLPAGTVFQFQPLDGADISGELVS